MSKPTKHDMYGYELSKSDKYILYHDDVEVMCGSEDEIWKHIHMNHGYSIAHALKYEGYKIVPE